MSIRQLEQSHTDLSKIPPLETNRLIGFVNNFAYNLITVSLFIDNLIPCLTCLFHDLRQQLNNLVEAADTRLLTIHNKILICKTNLVILEKKLSSVPGLDATSSVLETQSVTSTATSSMIQNTGREDEPRAPETPSLGNISPVVAESSLNEEKTEEDSQETTEAVNPELTKFYRMLKVGVPLPAVKIKMQTEGFDPNLLKT